MKYKNNILIRDISFIGLKEKVNAYLVDSGDKPEARVIFVHPAPGNRSTLLKDAIELAGKNLVSILIEAPRGNPQKFNKIALEGVEQPEKYYNFLIKTAVDFRRALDLIMSLNDKNIKRVGFVGHSFGALFGEILSGVEERIDTYVLMAGVGSFTDVALMNIPDLKGKTLEKFKKTMDPIDPVHYISHASPSNLFFQFGIHDTFYPKQTFMDFYKAGSIPKSIEWYESDHYFNEDVYKDRIRRLVTQLGLK